MIVKVCGMRDEENIRQVAGLGVDLMGFIFYPKSKRFLSEEEGALLKKEGILSEESSRPFPGKVGVFVNASPEEMIDAVNQYGLDYLQLHGNESAEVCHALHNRGIALIKAFSIASPDDFAQTQEYEGRVDYFLFDTKCDTYGGSGKQFDWSVLSAYTGSTPFLLSGGINPDSIRSIKELKHPRFVGIDLNSGFELEPGLKNIKTLEPFIKTLKRNKMNRITNLFSTKNNNILSIYFTAGYPQLNDTMTVLQELQDKGINMVEIGIPFSDPMADGPVIQEASTQALRNGMSLKLLFEQLINMRERITIPVILMGYLNPIMQYGFERFCEDCVKTGVDGIIIPDLPYADYMSDYKEISERHGLKMIMLITPETSEERVRLIDEHTSGFIYMVSSAATTGAQQSFDEQKQAYFQHINSMNLKNPRLVGFGISNKATFDAAAANSSGAIIGSKFIQLLKSEETPALAIDKLLESIGQ